MELTAADVAMMEQAAAAIHPRRIDETPTVEVVLNVLAGVFAGLALFAVGDWLRTVDDAHPWF